MELKQQIILIVVYLSMAMLTSNRMIRYAQKMTEYGEPVTCYQSRTNQFIAASNCNCEIHFVMLEIYLIIIIIIICSSYIALYLAEASSKRFTYYYPWQTCSIRHLLNSPGSIHPLTYFSPDNVFQHYLNDVFKNIC